jgi:hypothetical protein
MNVGPDSTYVRGDKCAGGASLLFCVYLAVFKVRNLTFDKDQLLWRQGQTQRLTFLLDKGVEVGGMSGRYREEAVRLGLKEGPEAVHIDSPLSSSTKYSASRRNNLGRIINSVLSALVTGA